MPADPSLRHASRGYRAAWQQLGTCPIELRDAVNECRHGRCAFDQSPPCGCHPEEGGAVMQLTLEVAAVAA